MKREMHTCLQYYSKQIVMGKKTFFITILAGVFFFFIIPSRVSAQSDTLSFLHISDIHLIFNFDIVQKDLSNDRLGWRSSQENTGVPATGQKDLVNDRGHHGLGVVSFDRFLQKISRENKIDFITITGDLVDFYEGEAKNNGFLSSQVEQFRQLINKNMPVYATLGNHDITRYSWDNTRISTQSEAERAKATWIRNVPCFQNGTYYSRIYHVGKTYYRLIFLDDGFDLFDIKGDFEIPYIDKAQQNWLKSQLTASEDDIEIIFMHIPLGQGVSDVQENSIYSVINGHSTLKAIFAGHHHQNIVSLFESGNDQFYQVLTAAFAKDSAAWRYIRLTEDNIIISSPGKMENELIIPRK